MSLDETNENFILHFIIYERSPRVIIFIQTFSSGNTLYFLHHQLEIETFFVAGTPNLLRVPRTRMRAGQVLKDWWDLVSCWTRIYCQRLSSAHAAPPAAPASWPLPACCVFNLQEQIEVSTHRTHEENLNASSTALQKLAQTNMQNMQRNMQKAIRRTCKMR